MNVRETIGKSWKLALAVIAAAQVGVFFLPYYHLQLGEHAIATSAYRIAFGFDRVEELAPAVAPSGFREVDAHAVAKVNEAIQYEHAQDPDSDVVKRSHRRFVPFYFLSAIVLGVLAVVALARRDLSWIGGLISICVAAYVLWGWSREALVDRATAMLSTGIGSTLLGLTGLLALGVGVGVMLIADPGGPLRKQRIALARARVIERRRSARTPRSPTSPSP